MLNQLIKVIVARIPVAMELLVIFQLLCGIECISGIITSISGYLKISFSFYFKKFVFCH